MITRFYKVTYEYKVRSKNEVFTEFMVLKHKSWFQDVDAVMEEIRGGEYLKSHLVFVKVTNITRI